MKVRIERELLAPVEKQRNVKLGEGGIREVEFFHAGVAVGQRRRTSTRIRERNTLRALSLLARYEFIPRKEEKALSRAYRFLRNVEHKIQVVQEAHSHLIPEGESEERSLARRLGYRKRGTSDERSSLRATTGAIPRRVRRAFERLFYSAQKDMAPTRTASRFAEIWKDLDEEEKIVEELSAIGFCGSAAKHTPACSPCVTAKLIRLRARAGLKSCARLGRP